MGVKFTNRCHPPESYVWKELEGDVARFYTYLGSTPSSALAASKSAVLTSRLAIAILSLCTPPPPKRF